MNNLILEPMVPSQQAAVARLFHDVWHETQAPLQSPLKANCRNLAFFMDRVTARAERTLVAESGGEIAGFSSWTDHKLNSLFVGKAFRSCGIGKALLYGAEECMRKAGFEVFQLDCVEGNWVARRFYERYGWRVQATEESVDDFPEGRIVTQHWVMVKP